MKFQGDMLNYCDFIQVFVFTRNHHLNLDTSSKYSPKNVVGGIINVLSPTLIGLKDPGWMDGCLNYLWTLNLNRAYSV